VKERKKVEIQNPQQVTMKNGRPAIQGTCPDCGTKIFKIETRIPADPRCGGEAMKPSGPGGFGLGAGRCRPGSAW
jgi:hypothetical protein